MRKSKKNVAGLFAILFVICLASASYAQPPGQNHVFGGTAYNADETVAANGTITVKLKDTTAADANLGDFLTSQTGTTATTDANGKYQFAIIDENAAQGDVVYIYLNGTITTETENGDHTYSPGTTTSLDLHPTSSGTTGPHTVTFDVNDTSMGSITGTTPQEVADAGSTTAVTANAADGYDFVNWTGTGDFSSTENPLTVTNVTQDMTITANFEAETFAVNSISDTSATEGAEITVSGSGFDDTTNVLFAAKDETTTAATSVEYTDSNTLVATVPDLSGKEGPFSIIVEKGGNQVPLEGTSFSYVSTFPVGDADESGTVDIFDALTVALYAAGVIDDTQINLSVSDVSCTGNTTERPVNTNDALAIAEHDVGIDGKTVNDLTLCTQ